MPAVSDVQLQSSSLAEISLSIAIDFAAEIDWHVSWEPTTYWLSVQLNAGEAVGVAIAVPVAVGE